MLAARLFGSSAFTNRFNRFARTSFRSRTDLEPHLGCFRLGSSSNILLNDRELADEKKIGLEPRNLEWKANTRDKRQSIANQIVFGPTQRGIFAPFDPRERGRVAGPGGRVDTNLVLFKIFGNLLGWFCSILSCLVPLRLLCYSEQFIASLFEKNTLLDNLHSFVNLVSQRLFKWTPWLWIYIASFGVRKQW